jgi:hypothetical protein
MRRNELARIVGQVRQLEQVGIPLGGLARYATASRDLGLWRDAMRLHFSLDDRLRFGNTLGQDFRQFDATKPAL